MLIAAAIFLIWDYLDCIASGRMSFCFVFRLLVVAKTSVWIGEVVWLQARPDMCVDW